MKVAVKQGRTLPLLYLYTVPVLSNWRTWYYWHLGPAQLQEDSQTTLPLRYDKMSMTCIIQIDLNWSNISITNQRWGREEPSVSQSNNCPPRSAIHVARVHGWQSRVLHSIRSHLILFSTAVGEVCVLSCSTCIYREWTPLAYNMWTIQAAQILQYRYAPHNDVSVDDGPHIRRWSHNIIIPLCYNCLEYSEQ
jgi:hypothetical protein